MADRGVHELQVKTDELIEVIHLMKLRLEVKYGPSIKRKWTHHKRKITDGINHAAFISSNSDRL